MHQYRDPVRTYHPILQALKFVINESRPPAGRKGDPGMPSSHANSLAFLSTYVSLAAAASYNPGASLAGVLGWAAAVGALMGWVAGAIAPVAGGNKACSNA
jgi:hypothetical protein